MKNNYLIFSVLIILFYGCNSNTKNTNPFKQGYKNIINSKTSFKSTQIALSTSEGLHNAFDTDKNTKFLVPDSKNTLIIKNSATSIIKRYGITSANDAPGRDPKNWTLSGSIDGENWDVLDIKMNEEFDKRGITNTYHLENNKKKYSFYKFDLEHAHTSIYGDDYLQIAEIELVALTNLPVTAFTNDRSRTKILDTIHFKDTSANSPDSWQWVFENGTPSKSILQNPTVVYNSPGHHNVTLITSNKFGADTLILKRKIKIYDPKNPWEGFYYPSINLTHTDTVSQGYKRALRVIPDLKKTINDITLGVCKQLYKNVSEIPDFETLNFTFNWSDVLAAKGGNATSMELWFSTKYIQNALKYEPDHAVKYEIYGVLWHELTHGYQFSPSTINDQYKRGTDYFAFLEGEADLVRINAGFHKTRHPDLGSDGHKYLSGYTTTGFFLHWITNTYDKDFIYKFNASVKTIKPWSYQAAFQQILQQDVAALWLTYETYVQNYKKHNTIDQKKKIDWTQP